MKSIYSFDGGKGGTGKSTVCASFIDVCLNIAKKETLVIEADTSNPDIAKMYNSAVETLPICLDTREGFLELATAIHKTPAEVIIINNPARSEKWLQYGDVLTRNFDRLDARMCVFWVANRQKDSLELCKNFVEKFTEIPLFFCMNSYFGDHGKFELWSQSKLRAKVLENGGGEIVFPDCADRVMHAMRNDRLRWDQAEALDFGNLIEAERMRNECTQIFTPFIMNS